jgi:2-polyprenyl-6-methoxyphenol hydroxylase-like FAD-dependent oxidoreductase
MTDVLIIGAGPSGALSAALLADQGYDVLVLEKQTFPRFSIGESLLANSAEMLKDAGMLDAVMSCGFQYKNGAAFVHDDRYSEFNFADKVAEGLPFTFQVPRARFDQALADEASRRGAQIRYGVRRSARIGRASCSMPAALAAPCRACWTWNAPRIFRRAPRCSCT